MSPEEQIKHFLNVKGSCRRTAKDCCKERCIYKASVPKLCNREDLYAWAKAHRNDYLNGSGYCQSIWE